jgi:hypothetical protein
MIRYRRGMRTLALVLVLSSWACKSESKSAPPASKESGKEAPVQDAVYEIAKQPRTAIAGKTGFLEFTLDLPEAASRPLKGEQATSYTFKDSKLELEVKEVSVPPTDSKAGSPPNVDSKMKRTLKEEAGAYLVVDRMDDATAFELEYCRDLDPKQPPSGICCRAALRSATPLVDIDKLIAFGEQLCRSIKVQNRTAGSGG